MSASMIISCKQVGRSKPLFADWAVPIPPDFGDGGGHLTLRDLIARIVRAEVTGFRKRQEERRVVRVLTSRQIADAAVKGKIVSGGSELEQQVDDDHAEAAALQAFEDGLYMVVIDDQQARELDREVFIQPDSRVTFLRLTMLAGG